MSGVEFKRDPRDGQLKFMEVNARHVSRHTIAAVSASTSRSSPTAMRLGAPSITAPPQVEGPRWIYAAFDVPDSLREIARGEMSALEWLTSLRGTRVDGMLALDDPLPGVLEFAHFASRSLKRRTMEAIKAHDDTWG